MLNTITVLKLHIGTYFKIFLFLLLFTIALSVIGEKSLGLFGGNRELAGRFYKILFAFLTGAMLISLTPVFVTIFFSMAGKMFNSQSGAVVSFFTNPNASQTATMISVLLMVFFALGTIVMTIDIARETKIVEVKTFSCDGMTGFTFDYPVFKGWEVLSSKKSKKSDGNDECFLLLNDSREVSLETVPQIIITKGSYSKKDFEIPAQAVSYPNPNNVPYIYTKENSVFEIKNYGYVIFYGKDFKLWISLDGISEKSGFSTEQFFKTVIESFKLSLTLEKAKQLAEQLINQNSPVRMVIKEVKEKPDGWIFYYDSADAVKTGDYQKYGVPGNNPLFVGKDGTTKYIPNPNDPILSQ